MLVNRLVEFCRKAGYVTDEQEPWIKYILEKRITTICVLIPFFVIGVALTSLATAASFLVAFYLLRSRINGFHAKTFWGCFFASLIWEFVFLGLVYPIINNVASLIVLAVSIVAILMLAPFRHPSLPLSEDEYQASKCSARYRLALLTIVYIVFALFNLKAAALGILLGIATYTFTATNYSGRYCATTNGYGYNGTFYVLQNGEEPVTLVQGNFTFAPCGCSNLITSVVDVNFA